MAINTLEFNEKLTAQLDKAVVQKSVTGFLADNNLRAKFVGAKTVILPDVDMAGLVNYDRDGGFTRGALNINHTPYTLTMDRGRTFQIDREDEDETGVANLAGQIMTEFVRTKVVPEMDAYVLSKLAGVATTVTGSGGTLLADCYSIFDEALRQAEAASGNTEEMVAFVDQSFWAALNNSTAFQRSVTVSDFSKGSIHTKVKCINGCPILPVPDARMKTAYVFDNGTTADDEGGFAPAGNAKSIGLIVLPKKGASLVKKTEQTRIFNPRENQGADAWKLDYRIYYDLFVKNSNKGAIWAYIAE